MRQAELVERLSRVGNENLETAPGRPHGKGVFALFLGHYIRHYINRQDRPIYDLGHDSFDADLSSIVLRAIQGFEKSDKPLRAYRTLYEDAVGHSFTDPTRVNSGDSLRGIMFVEMVKNLLTDVMCKGEGVDRLVHEVDTLLNAERNILHLRFRQFQDQVFNAGGLVGAAKSRAFGATTLNTFVSSGRLIFTFARGTSVGEQSVRFVCVEDDRSGLGGGLQFCDAELHDALAMIEEVIENWPTQIADISS